MTQTVRGIFYTPEDAERAIADLIERGFPKEKISVIAPGTPEAEHVHIKGSGVEHVEDMAIGAVGGGLFGGALGAVVGMAVVGIPGVAVLLVGPIAAAIFGAGAGAVGGGILGALGWAGITENESHVYEEFLRRGGTLVMVQATAAEAPLATEILHRDGAAETPDIEAEWMREGLA